MRADEIEELICLIAAMDRTSVIGQITTYRAGFPIDFTREFLDAQTTERLRHLLLAISVQAARSASIEAPQAA